VSRLFQRQARRYRILSPGCRKSAIYGRFFNVALTESFAMFRREDERWLNARNELRMNCVNIVERAADGRRGAQFAGNHPARPGRCVLSV